LISSHSPPLDRLIRSFRAREAEGVVEEQALEGVAVLDGAVGSKRGVKEVFIFVLW
jgi:hypothetical protein